MTGLSSLILFALLASGGLSQTVIPPDNTFRTFAWTNSGNEKNLGQFSITLTEPGFVTLTDYQCPGDQFKVFLPNNVELGTTSTPQTTCTNEISSPLVALSDQRFSKGLFYIPNAGTSTLRVRIIANSIKVPNRAAIRARPAVCQGPPARQSEEFALVSRLISGGSAASTCEAFGFKLAEITPGNLPEASATANSCLLTMKADSQNQVFIRSWNGDSNFGGVTGSLQLVRSIPTFGHPIGSDGLQHYALCQTITPVDNGSGSTAGTCSVVARSPDNLFAIVRPNGLFSNRATACSCAGSGYTLALFPTAKATEILTLSNLVYSSLGPNGRAWVAGYTTPVDNFAFYSPAVSGVSGSINPSDPAVPIPFVCKNPAGATVIDDGNGTGTGSGGCEVVSRSPDNNLAIIRPNGPSNNFISACRQCLNFVPAVLSANRPIERDAAYALTFSTVGPTGRVWVGGWETATDNLAMTAGAATSGAFFVPGDVGAFQYAYLCKNPAAPARRSPQDEL